MVVGESTGDTCRWCWRCSEAYKQDILLNRYHSHEFWAHTTGLSRLRWCGPALSDLPGMYVST
jgi:hypothetical protein